MENLYKEIFKIYILKLKLEGVSSRIPKIQGMIKE